MAQRQSRGGAHGAGIAQAGRENADHALREGEGDGQSQREMSEFGDHEFVLFTCIVFQVSAAGGGPYLGFHLPVFCRASSTSLGM